MSIVSDSALGMGESDSRGFIWQPMVEWEVVPIEDSSSEEVPCEVSDNGSSSYKRLIDFDNVGEGNSELPTGIESLMTPRKDQPSPITTVVPPPP